MWLCCGSRSASSTRTKDHWSRSTGVAGLLGRSRTVSVASASSGSTAGLGRCWRSASRNTWVGSLHWNWHMILPVSGPCGPMASGAWSPMSPGVGGTSACQPPQTTV